MHSPFQVSDSQKENPLDTVNPLMHSTREEFDLHGMIGNPSKRGFGQGGPTNYIDEFSFPSNKFCMHIVKQEMEVKRLRSGVKHRDPRYFLNVELVLMPRIWDGSCWVARLQFFEKTTLDL